MIDNADALNAIALRRTHSLTDIVRKELERMILSGELTSGERINEQMLAAKLGVSRGPIREASRALERAGLVTSIINQGSYVREISVEEAQEIYDIRGLLFGFACGRLARTRTDAMVAGLGALCDAMDDAIARADAERYYELNLDFHKAIESASGHNRLIQLTEALVKELHLVRRRTLTSGERMRESNWEHRQLLDAIRNGEEMRARFLAEEHIQGGKRRWNSFRAEEAQLTNR